MFSKLWLINIILAAGVIFFAVKTYDVWVEKDIKEPAPIPAPKKTDAQEKQFLKRNLPSESSYRSVVDKNLFAEDRAEYLPPAPEPEPENGVEEKEPEPEIKPFEGFGKKVTLYGVVLYKDYKKALITNPSRKRGEPKDIWVEKGDVVLEVRKRNQVAVLKVDDIFEDRLLLRDDQNRYEVLLYDKENPKQRPAVQKEKAPQVVRPQITPGKAPAKAGEKPVRKKAPERASREVKSKKESDPKFEIINTPFGEIKRRKK